MTLAIVSGLTFILFKGFVYIRQKRFGTIPLSDSHKFPMLEIKKGQMSDIRNVPF